MARRKVKVDLTLFPFLSVLAGLIAVLMLFMIVTVSTRVIAADDRRGGDQGNAEDGIDPESYDRLAAEINRLVGLLAQRQQEYSELERLQEELRALIDAKKAEMQLAREGAQGRRRGLKLGEPSPVEVVPAKGYEVKKKPILIEVKADGYLVHLKEATHFPAVVEQKVGEEEKYTADPKLVAFLNQVDKNRANEYLLFLLHPSGVSVYDNLRRYLLHNYSEKIQNPLGGGVVQVITKTRIDIGDEPFSPEWLLLRK